MIVYGSHNFIMRAINYHEKFSATKAANTGTACVITVTQFTSGADGNTTITITELGATGLSKADFTGGTTGEPHRTKLNVRIYTSLTGSDAKTLPIGGGVTVADQFVITASYISSGTYSASFAYTGALTTIYDVWSTGSNTSYRGSGASYKEFHTGSGISVKSFNSYDYNPNDTYVTSIPNLKSIYSTAETALSLIHI